jgi:predicted DNA-binding helix-hairpin-helix protein
MTKADVFVGQRVRQSDWLLRPSGYRDGEIVALAEDVPGTPHRWVVVKFDRVPDPLRCSTAQLGTLR